MSYIWNHTVCSHFRQTSFTWQCVFMIPPCFLAWKPFLALNNNALYGRSHILFNHLLVERCSGSFQVLAIMNQVALNIHMQVFMWMYIFSSVKWKPKHAIGGFYGKTMCSFVRHCQIVFWRGCTVLNADQQWIRSTGSGSRVCQHLVFPI